MTTPDPVVTVYRPVGPTTPEECPTVTHFPPLLEFGVIAAERSLLFPACNVVLESPLAQDAGNFAGYPDARVTMGKMRS